MKNKKLIFSAILIMILSFIWINSMLSKEMSKALSDFVLSILFDTKNTGNTGEGFPVRKIAHFLEFAALGCDIYLLKYLDNFKTDNKNFISALSFSALCAATDETIQIFSHRGNSILDVLLDTCGAGFGIAMTVLILIKTKKRGQQ